MSLAKTCLRWGNTFIAMQSGLVFSCLPNCKPHGCPAHERPQKKRLENSRTLNSSQLHPANSTRGFPVCSQPFCLRFFLQVLLSVETQVIKSCGRDYRSSQVWPKDPRFQQPWPKQRPRPRARGAAASFCLMAKIGSSNNNTSGFLKKPNSAFKHSLLCI